MVDRPLPAGWKARRQNCDSREERWKNRRRDRKEVGKVGFGSLRDFLAGLLGSPPATLTVSLGTSLGLACPILSRTGLLLTPKASKALPGSFVGVAGLWLPQKDPWDVPAVGIRLVTSEWWGARPSSASPVRVGLSWGL